MALEEIPLPVAADYVAKVWIDPNADGKFTPGDSAIASHRFQQVEVAWYENPDRVKLILKDGGKASVNQFYRGGGKNVVLEVEARD